MCIIDVEKHQQKSSWSVIKGGKLLQVSDLMDDAIFAKVTKPNSFKDNYYSTKTCEKPS